MPLEKLSIEDIIVGKMKRVIAYNKTLIGQSFGDDYEGGRNRLAKIVIFKVNYGKLGSLMNEIVGREWSQEEKTGINTWLNALIDISNTEDSYWEAFWEGKLTFKPEDYSITTKICGKKVHQSMYNLSKITILE